MSARPEDRRLMCPKCGAEITPGSQVAIVLDPSLDFEDVRILTDDQLVVAHEVCPGREGPEAEAAPAEGGLCENCGEENVFGGVCELCGAPADYREGDVG